MNEEEKKALEERKHGLDLMLQVLATQPGVIKPNDEAYPVVRMIAEMSELLLLYEKTGKIPQFSPSVVSDLGAQR